jgi:hypothetical protein
MERAGERALERAGERALERAGEQRRIICMCCAGLQRTNIEPQQLGGCRDVA